MNAQPSILDRLYALEGKIALVTGGSRGIGEMIARGFVEAGVKTYIVSRKADECKAAAARLSRFGDCVAIPADLSTLDGIKALVDIFDQREAALDILVNNAGAAWGAAIEDYPEAGWDKVVDLNLKSPFFLIQKFLSYLQVNANSDDPSRIVNVASINGLTHPHANNYAYSASKAGMLHLTRHLAGDLAARHVNVNAVAPGLFMTKMMSHVSETEAVAGIPLGRAGSFEDAAGVTIFLCSRASAWITGATLPVDGGLVANA